MATNNRGIALGAVAVGGIFAWSGLFNKKISATIKDLIKGQKPTPGPTSNNVSNDTVAANQMLINQATGNTGAQSNTAEANQAIAKKLTVVFGWSEGNQWNCLVDLWNDESGWSNTAENASGAYGVAQALPNTKYPKAGQPPSEGGSANASVQIAWGLAYILSTYGSPCAALAHENADHWY
jgi:hypothetical protein